MFHSDELFVTVTYAVLDSHLHISASAAFQPHLDISGKKELVHSLFVFTYQVG